MSLILPINIALNNAWLDITDDIFNSYESGDNVDIYIIFVDSQPFEVIVDKSGVALIDDTFNEKGLRIDQYFNTGGYTLNRTFKYYARCIDKKAVLNIRPTQAVQSPVASSDFANKQPMNTIVGEVIVGERTDMVNVMFEYNIATADTNPTQTGTGNISHSNSKAVLGCGTGVGKYELRSKAFVRYVTGHEVNAELTADFGIPEVNVLQKVGIGDNDDGFAGFGYDGLTFGLWMLTIDGGTFHIPQDDWNIDKVDGNGESGETLVPQNYNIYKVTYGWYGILPIDFYIYTKSKGWMRVHSFNEVNETQNPHLGNPTLPMCCLIERTSGSGSDVKLNTSSWRGGIVGFVGDGALIDRKFMVKTVKTITGSNAPIMSIRSNPNFQGKENHVRIRLGTFTASADGTKAVEVDVWKSGTLTGGVWTPYDAVNSVADFNNTATSFVPPPGRVSGGTVLGKVDRDRINLVEGDVIIPIYPGEELHFVATTSQGSSEMVVFIRHIEDF